MPHPDLVKIDAYSHISPPRYSETLSHEFPAFYNQILGNTQALFDLEARFRVMDAFGPLAQVLIIGPVPGLEELATPQRAAELARMAFRDNAVKLLKLEA
jgi:hypothetical protein